MIKDITNQKFGKLTILKYLGNSMWECKCDCGNITKTTSWNIKSGHTKSCGCIHKKYGGKVSNDRLYRLYCSLKQRTTKLRKDFHNITYIEREIKVCDEWLKDFNNFKKWALENGYDYNKSYREQTIDRINPFGNYEPSNCRFINRKENNQIGIICLPLEQQKQIYKLYLKGWKKQDLAEKYLVSRATIRRVIKKMEKLEND